MYKHNDSKKITSNTVRCTTAQKKTENKTGLPDNLKAGIEHLSGYSMDDVNVHFNSNKPAELQAHAYAQGTNIYLAPGQEKHLPHEAWHVIQQKQGRVHPTMQYQFKTPINSEPELEKEADEMGVRALQTRDSDTQQRSSLNMPIQQKVVQRVNHSIIGTMIHHAPKNWGNTNIDRANEIFYPSNSVLASRRGALRNIPATTYDWDFNSLVGKISATRRKTGLPPSSFPVVVNANAMVSPGYNEAPKEYADMREEVFAINSVWGFDYKLPTGVGDDNYDSVLTHWKEEKDVTRSSRRDTVKLGDEAKKLLRTHAVNKLKASRNDAIPHRGLRNKFFKDRWFQRELGSLERRGQYVHVMTLDSDADLGSGGVLDEIADNAEAQLHHGGMRITATDYVYDKANIFEWFAGLLDKVGRREMEKAGHDAYPAEPGLTISYASTSGEEARAFLQDDPFGPEYAGDPRDGIFKEHVNSSQSVEGKNIREKWRKSRLAPRRDTPINRTKAYLNVQESDAQHRGQGPTLERIEALATRKEEIPADLIQSLINSDNYHSLTPDRSSDLRRTAQARIVAVATRILNTELSSEDPLAVKKAKIEAALLS